MSKYRKCPICKKEMKPNGATLFFYDGNAGYHQTCWDKQEAMKVDWAMAKHIQYNENYYFALVDVIADSFEKLGVPVREMAETRAKDLTSPTPPNEK